MLNQPGEGLKACVLLLVLGGRYHVLLNANCDKNIIDLECLIMLIKCHFSATTDDVINLIH